MRMMMIMINYFDDSRDDDGDDGGDDECVFLKVWRLEAKSKLLYFFWNLKIVRKIRWRRDGDEENNWKIGRLIGI